MKRNLTLLIALVFSFNIRAQQLSPSVIAATGGFASTANNSFSYTVGEMTMVQTFSAGAVVLTQGFQQPNDIATGLLAANSNADWELEIYPNPTTERLWYTFQFSNQGSITFAITNLLGQRIAEVFEENYRGEKITESADVSALAAGTYFLTAYCANSFDGGHSTITRKFEVIR